MMIFAFGTIWFWVLSVIALVAISGLFAERSPIWASFCLAGYLALIYFFGDALQALLPWIADHAAEGALLIGLYFAIGAVWSIIKWFLFVKKLSWAYVEKRIAFLKAVQAQGPMKRYDRDEDMTPYTIEPLKTVIVTEHTPVPTECQSEWARQSFELSDGETFSASQVSKLEVRDHKSRILTWIGFWPFSMLWTLIDDPIRWLVRYTYELLTGIFKRISNSVLGGINAAKDVK